MFGFFNLPISDKKMSKVMYALLRTRSKLVNSYSHSISQYTRKQSSGFLVQVLVEVEEPKIKLFEELAEVTLQTSEEFQGKMHLNFINSPTLTETDIEQIEGREISRQGNIVNSTEA